MATKTKSEKTVGQRSEDIEKKLAAIQKLLSTKTIFGPKEKAHQIWQWIGSASLYSDIIIRDGANTNEQVIGLFWIRLYGILHDIREYFCSFSKDHLELKPINSDILHKASLTEIENILPTANRFIGIITAIKDKFTKDELVYLQYRRDVEAHPFQTSYEISANSNWELRDKRRCVLVSNELVDKDQLYDMIACVLKQRRYNKSEKDIAVDFANRINLLLEELWKISIQIKQNAILFGRMAV